MHNHGPNTIFNIVLLSYIYIYIYIYIYVFRAHVINDSAALIYISVCQLHASSYCHTVQQEGG
jgi:hypothetical protein